MKAVAILLKKIGDWFIQLEYKYVEERIASFFYKVSRKIYPKGYCRYCGVWLELCYNKGTPEKLFCCNCEKSYKK